MLRRRFKVALRIGAAAVLVLGVLAVVARLSGLGCAGRGDSFSPGGPAASAADLLQGDWVGRWASSQSDMGNDLKARIRKLDAGKYEAQFDAVFARFFTNRSVVVLTVRDKGTKWEFSGQEDLGFFRGGIYKYEGTCDGREFLCTYDSSYDKGTFRMRRAGAATTAPAD